MVSVIIPCYNRENRIVRAVESVLNQTYSDIEVIVSDDCSTDGSVSAVSAISDPRLRVIRMPKNGGACAARNAGIREAKGEFIAFQDSDDAWKPEKLERQMAYLEENRLDICVCQMNSYRYGEEPRVLPQLEEGLIEYETLIDRMVTSTQTLLMKREVLAGCLFDEKLPRLQDYDLMIRAARGRRVGFLAEPLVDVYDSSDSITAKQIHRNAEVYGYLIHKYREMFPEHPLFEAELYHWYGMYLIKDGHSRAGTRALKVAAANDGRLRKKYLLAKCGILQIYYRIRRY